MSPLIAFTFANNKPSTINFHFEVMLVECQHEPENLNQFKDISISTRKSMFRRLIITFSFLFPFLASFSIVHGQSDIKVYDQKVNHLDKKKRKQGEWIYFDRNGFLVMTCVYENDKCVSPMIFFENRDTAFIRLPAEASSETFMVYYEKNKYVGDFIYEKDSITRIDIEIDGAIPDSLIRKIKKYQDFLIPPNYYFGQMLLQDYITSTFSSANFVLNKPITAILHIDASGIISDVEFPAEKNNLSATEEKNLRWMYLTMPRWQPLFIANRALPTKVSFTNNSRIL